MADYLHAVGGRREFLDALAGQQLLTYFQPVVELATGAVRGAESLLRWQHPRRGLLPAAAFLAPYENSPVMKSLTWFVLREACLAMAEGAPPSWSVSVNVTAADAGRGDLVDQVAAALDLSGLAPQRLVLEVTETGLLTNPVRAAEVLSRIRDTGVGISLDDFGTGYSSLRLLRELPISELKIDALFVAEVETSDSDAAIVSNVVQLADAFGATVVAEGVERPGQAARLHQLGCGFGQGYLWSRPAPLDQVVGLRVAPVPPALPAPERCQTEPVLELTTKVGSLLCAGASLHSIAAALNADGLRTTQGRRWHATSVSLLLAELGLAPPTRPPGAN